ncbi:MAG: hypothetical protein KDA61_02260 [Planctomycetales bacterium]|nr:hypothetical protein [Planctomycetales bacterium]
MPSPCLFRPATRVVARIVATFWLTCAGGLGWTMSVDLDPGVHHMGPDAEGARWQMSFDVAAVEPQLYIDVRFIGPAGPNQTTPPQFILNGVALAPIAPLFPRFHDNDQRWRVNDDGSREFNGAFSVRLPASHLLRTGNNELVVESGRPDDEYYFRGIRLRTIRSHLKVLSWNVESGDATPEDPHNGSDPKTIARELFELADRDVVGLSEVRVGHIARYVAALTAGGGGTFDCIHGGTGGDDRLVLAYDTDALALVAGYELHAASDELLNSRHYEGDWRHRSPLAAHFRHRDSGVEFIAVVNHLARGDEMVRLRQAIGLWEWAGRERIPIIALGDFNFDYEFASQTGNGAWSAFLRRDRWKWIRPSTLVDTNWADRTGNGDDDPRVDQYPDSMLDFVFAAGRAHDWPAESRVVVRDGDFPDTSATSDHRPVQAEFQLPIVGLATETSPPAP